MSLTPQEPDRTLGFEVIVHQNGEIAARARFDSLEEAAEFADAWSERVPSAHCEIEDRYGDHTAREIIDSETALDEAYPTDFQRTAFS